MTFASFQQIEQRQELFMAHVPSLAQSLIALEYVIADMF